jgi:hypothetical protein
VAGVFSFLAECTEVRLRVSRGWSVQLLAECTEVRLSVQLLAECTEARQKKPQLSLRLSNLIRFMLNAF